jgi:hypothetical protein
MAGYKVFTRAAPFWGLYTFAWGYTLAPYVAFSGLIILIGARIVRIRLAGGFWTLQIPLLGKVDLANGRAGVQTVPPYVPTWEKWLDTVLNPL